MYANYPAGSMKGSGIYEHEQNLFVTCANDVDITDEDGVILDTVPCGYEGHEDVTFDDWGTGGWECPKCGGHNEHDA